MICGGRTELFFYDLVRGDRERTRALPCGLHVRERAARQATTGFRAW